MRQHSLLLSTLAIATKVLGASSSVPVDVIRGVNLGGYLIAEPWMMTSEWNKMGCGSGIKSEFDCMLQNPNAQAGFETHWQSWISADDFTRMASYGLNTVRIPIGYWIFEDLVYKDSEHFPTGGLPYLRQACQWAADAGLNVILVLHGAPGAQVANNPFTGQDASTPGFYQDYQYARAQDWASRMTKEVHGNSQYSTVFAIEAVNEPEGGHDSMINDYYPAFLNAVRSAESDLGISCSGSARRHARSFPSKTDKRAFSGCLNVQFMSTSWGAGNPVQNLSNEDSVIFDNHIYLKYRITGATTRAEYIAEACKGLDANDNSPVSIGEFSTSPAGDNEFYELSTENPDAASFYSQYFAALVQGFEQRQGWTYWTWKTDTLNDPRWDYQLAVERGYIPSDASAWDRSACDGY